MEIETTQEQPIVLTDGQKTKDWLHKKGIRYNFFAEQMGFGSSWASNIFNGTSRYTKDTKLKLKEVFPDLYEHLFSETSN